MQINWAWMAMFSKMGNGFTNLDTQAKELSLDQFMERRGAATIVRKGRQLKQQNAQLLASIVAMLGILACGVGVLFTSACWRMKAFVSRTSWCQRPKWRPCRLNWVRV